MERLHRRTPAFALVCLALAAAAATDVHAATGVFRLRDREIAPRALTPPLEAHMQTLVETVRTLLAAQGSAPRTRPMGEARPAVGITAGAKPPSRGVAWPIVAGLLAILVIGAGGVFYWFGGERQAPSSRTIQVFNLPTEQDLKRIREVAADHALILPELAFHAPTGNISPSALRFIGVWSSDIGYNGTGSQAMLIVATEGADGRSEGFVLNGPATPLSYDPNRPANTFPFRGEIDGDVLNVKPENSKVNYIARLNLAADAMTLSVNRPDGKPAVIVLKPIWRLTGGT